MLENSTVYVFEKILPLDLLYVINSFLPKPLKQKKEHISPSMQKALYSIQSLKLKGVSGMYMRELDYFVLD